MSGADIVIFNRKCLWCAGPLYQFVYTHEAVVQNLASCKQKGCKGNFFERLSAGKRYRLDSLETREMAKEINASMVHFGGLRTDEALTIAKDLLNAGWVKVDAPEAEIEESR